MKYYKLDIVNIDYSNSYPIVLDLPYNISVSHCDEWVVLAVSNNAVGRDIEKVFEVWTFKEAYFRSKKEGILRKSKLINFRITIKIMIILIILLFVYMKKAQFIKEY